jgi:hypothetical protein
MISTEIHNEVPIVVIFTCGRDRTWTDRTDEGMKTEQWVRNSKGPIPAFDPQQEKETYQKERK